MSNEGNAKQIKTAYATWITQYPTAEGMSITEIIDRTDLNLEEITEAVKHLSQTDMGFYVSPRSDQWNLTAEDQANRLWIGNQHKDLITWM